MNTIINKLLVKLVNLAVKRDLVFIIIDASSEGDERFQNPTFSPDKTSFEVKGQIELWLTDPKGLVLNKRTQ